jgi:xanthine dehydrogenase accessory factor
MISDVMEKWVEAQKSHTPSALVTVAAVAGSVPRETGSKMLIYADGKTNGTIGGGKFEALVIDAALEAIPTGETVLKTYPLRENHADSFGAICGGEVTVLIESQHPAGRLILSGAGHCSQAIAALAKSCGYAVIVIDDRTELANQSAFPEADQFVSDQTNEIFFERLTWSLNDAVALVNRNYILDKEALRCLLPHLSKIGFVGMIGSRRKVRRVYEELRSEGCAIDPTDRVYAPIGLDIGADSPQEIAISVLAEILAVRRNATAGHLNRSLKNSGSP